MTSHNSQPTITNYHQLAVTPARTLALDLIQVGLAAIDTTAVIKNNVSRQSDRLKVQDRSFPLSAGGRLIVVAIGKCALEAAAALEEILGNQIAGGVSIDTRTDPTCPLRYIECYQGDHPFPTERNITATSRIIKLLSGLTEADTVIAVISGGGSTLLCQPENFTCQAEESLIQHLFAVGADIAEINTMRKHLSLIRGGHMAKLAYPAQVVSLIFSDVPGHRPDVVASGPTYLDQTTVEDARQICRQYDLCQKTGFAQDHFLDTPKDEKFFRRVTNLVLVDNQLALAAMARAAQSAGRPVKIVTNTLAGQAAQQGQLIAKQLATEPAGQVLLYGGETTVNITGSGRGGRNQELALAALTELIDDCLVLALASDGRDNSDRGGALVDKITKQQMTAKQLDPQTYLVDNNSATFFDQIGDYLITGPTGVNVADLIIAMKD